MNDNIESVINTLMHGNQLKRTARTGWVQRGIPEAEDVAAHSYGVAFTALILAQKAEDRLDVGKLLTMALLHDLPEGLTSDIPTPSWRRLPPGSKQLVEETAMQDILAQTGFVSDLIILWREFKAGETDEARLVQDADKLDMYLQALIYEEHTGNRRLEEFWGTQPSFHFPLSQEVYRALRRRREGGERRIK